MSDIEIVTEILAKEILDTGKNYDHIAWNDDDAIAMCGHRFREPSEDEHTDWIAEDPWARCICGRTTCPECVNLCLAFSQLEYDE